VGPESVQGVALRVGHVDVAPRVAHGAGCAEALDGVRVGCVAPREAACAALHVGRVECVALRAEEARCVGCEARDVVAPRDGVARDGPRWISSSCC